VRVSEAPEISLLKRGHWARMASVMTSGSVRSARRPALGGSEERLRFHQWSTNTYNETKKESTSSMAPSFGESLVPQHTILTPSPLFAITHQTSKKFAKSKCVCVSSPRRALLCARAP
jgi:hypothetical protein